MALETSYGALVAATVTTFTWTGDYLVVEVLNRGGTAEIFFTVDGSVPASGAAGTYCLPAAAGASARIQLVPGQKTVKLISTGTPTYGVIPGIVFTTR